MELLNNYINDYKHVKEEIKNCEEKIKIIKCNLLNKLTDEEILEILQKNFVQFMYYYTAVKENKSCLAYEEWNDDFYLIQKSEIEKYFTFSFLEEFLTTSHLDSASNNIVFDIVITDNHNNEIVIPLVTTVEGSNEDYWQDSYKINKDFSFIAEKFYKVYNKYKTKIADVIKNLKN